MYFDLKTLCIWPRRVLGRRAPQKHRNTKTEARTVKIGGGNSTGTAAGGISTFSNVFLIITMIKRD
jgi:hypothetical protein